MERTTAFKIFRKAAERKPGKWALHSRYVAGTAKILAEKSGLDGQKAFMLGLMHDIGRSLTDGQFQHIYDGYCLMSENELPECARICLTHSFPIQNIYSYVGQLDVEETVIHECQKLLGEVEYNEYDWLIQLCDALATDKGMVCLEKRFVDSVLKYGFNEYTLRKWKRTYQLKEYFEGKINGCVYDLKYFVESELSLQWMDLTEQEKNGADGL